MNVEYLPWCREILKQPGKRPRGQPGQAPSGMANTKKDQTLHGHIRDISRFKHSRRRGTLQNTRAGRDGCRSSRATHFQTYILEVSRLSEHYLWSGFKLSTMSPKAVKVEPERLQNVSSSED